MLKAIDKFDNPVHIDYAEVGGVYFCPVCKQKLRQNRCISRRDHFAHIGKRGANKDNYVACTDRWHYCMSDWHMDWQSHFPIECQEVVVSNGEETHRADVLIDNTVIEFQHSRISIKEFRERNKFYTSCGYKVIWLFDIQDYVEGHLTITRSQNSSVLTFHWNDAPAFFKKLYIWGESADVFFQLFSESNEPLTKDILHIKNANNGMEDFFVDKYLWVDEFVNAAMSSSLLSKIPENPRVPSEYDIQRAKDLGGKTLHELWKEEYSGMVVANLAKDGAEMIINGKDGEMLREYGGKRRIIGKYSHKNDDGSYHYSDYYTVWDADKPIWKLVRYFKK